MRKGPLFGIESTDIGSKLVQIAAYLVSFFKITSN